MNCAIAKPMSNAIGGVTNEVKQKNSAMTKTISLVVIFLPKKFLNFSFAGISVFVSISDANFFDFH